MLADISLETELRIHEITSLLFRIQAFKLEASVDGGRTVEEVVASELGAISVIQQKKTEQSISIEMKKTNKIRSEQCDLIAFREMKIKSEQSIWWKLNQKMEKQINTIDLNSVKEIRSKQVQWPASSLRVREYLSRYFIALITSKLTTTSSIEGRFLGSGSRQLKMSSDALLAPFDGEYKLKTTLSGFDFLTATAIPIPTFDGAYVTPSTQPLKTLPKPPSPSMVSGRKFLVALRSSANVNIFKFGVTILPLGGTVSPEPLMAPPVSLPSSAASLKKWLVLFSYLLGVDRYLTQHHLALHEADTPPQLEIQLQGKFSELALQHKLNHRESLNPRIFLLHHSQMIISVIFSTMCKRAICSSKRPFPQLRILKTATANGGGSTLSQGGWNRERERERDGYFENSYIPENPRTPSISYISQTVIPFKKTDFGTIQKVFERFLSKNLKYAYVQKKIFCTYTKFLKKKIVFSEIFFCNRACI
ncbi:hypothetical protein LXL04_015224 [Taraxacum kok-saghyz]